MIAAPLSYKYPSAPHLQLHLPLTETRLPNRRTKEPPRGRWIWICNLNRCIQIIHVIIRNAHPPPARHRRIREVDREDNDNCANGQPRVQSRRRDVVEAHPPAPVLVSDVFIEDVADDAPGEVIERGSRWDFATAAEDEGSGEVAEGAAGESASEAVEEDRC